MKILVATGGAPHSEAALRFAKHLLQPQDRLTILTVAKQKSGQPYAKAILAQAQQQMALPEAQLETVLRSGHPAEEIIREAEENEYELIIVGQRQHHGLITRFLVGATAERVIEHAPCPVVIASGQIGAVRRLLLCDSGFQEPSLIGRFVSQLPELLTPDKAFTILHVMSQISAAPHLPSVELRASADILLAAQTPEGKLLAQDQALLQKYVADVEPKVRHGRVVEEILAEAQAGQHDLVVIGAHRSEGGWRRILLDDLAQQIIAQIDRPILVMR